jgi:hypothetical protein
MAYDDSNKAHKPSEEALKAAGAGTEAPDPLDPEEKGKYNALYNRLYPALKMGTLNFPEMAEKTGFKERRIRETLLFRLSSGEVMQLFGLRIGICYFCGVQVQNRKEPLCIPCLEKIEIASQAEPESKAIDEPVNPETETVSTSTPVSNAPTAATKTITIAEGDMLVHRREYEQMIQELLQYRALYGPLSDTISVVQRPEMPHSLVAEVLAEPWLEDSPHGAEQRAGQQSAADIVPETSARSSPSDPLNTLNFTLDELTEAPDDNLSKSDESDEPLSYKHYGFQRISSAKADRT